MCYKSQGTDENKAIIQGYFVLAHSCKGQRGCKAIVCFNNSLSQKSFGGLISGGNDASTSVL